MPLAEPTENDVENFLRRAAELRRIVRGLKPRAKGARVAIDDFPAITFTWMFSEALQYFDGALHLLAQPATSAAAFPVVRSLTEFAAQATWIARGSGDAKARRRRVSTRALCYELGVAHQATKNYAKLPTFAFGGRRAAAADERLKTIRFLHGRTGCRCRGRGYRVENTLKAMRHTGAWRFGHSYYVLASAFAHGFLPRWEVVGKGPEVRVGYPPAPRIRILLANTAVDALAVGGRSLIAAEFPGASLTVLDGWRATFADDYHKVTVG